MQNIDQLFQQGSKYKIPSGKTKFARNTGGQVTRGMRRAGGGGGAATAGGGVSIPRRLSRRPSSAALRRAPASGRRPSPRVHPLPVDDLSPLPANSNDLFSLTNVASAPDSRRGTALDIYATLPHIDVVDWAHRYLLWDILDIWIGKNCWNRKVVGFSVTSDYVCWGSGIALRVQRHGSVGGASAQRWCGFEDGRPARARSVRAMDCCGHPPGQYGAGAGNWDYGPYAPLPYAPYAHYYPPHHDPYRYYRYDYPTHHAHHNDHVMPMGGYQ